MAKNKRYTGTVYIGTVGPDLEPGYCRDSIEAIHRRNGDGEPVYVRATKGYEARQAHMDRWINETTHDFALFLDHDQIFPPETLERLRSHKLPYVSGLYMRRRFAPVAPVWYKLPPRGKWPMEPWVTEPERNKLHKLGASGWGCILIHRDVVAAVEPLLKGERLVIEDDMDIWPYDLERVFSALNGLTDLVTTEPPERVLRAALKEYEQTLRDEIRPLRAHKGVVGSDLRFPFFAREAGFVLMGDPEVRCAHNLFYPLQCDDFSALPEDLKVRLYHTTRKEVSRERRQHTQNLNNLEKAGQLESNVYSRRPG